MAIQFWPREQGHVAAQRESRVQKVSASAGGCAKAILRDWIPDGRVDGTYATSCYEALRRMVPETSYGTGSLLEAIDENLR